MGGGRVYRSMPPRPRIHLCSSVVPVSCLLPLASVLQSSVRRQRKQASKKLKPQMNAKHANGPAVDRCSKQSIASIVARKGSRASQPGGATYHSVPTRPRNHLRSLRSSAVQIPCLLPVASMCRSSDHQQSRQSKKLEPQMNAKNANGSAVYRSSKRSIASIVAHI